MQVRKWAREITANWRNMSPHALPYVRAMLSGDYGLDGERDVLLRFLCNAGTWRGSEARKVKEEIKDYLGI